MKNVETVNFFCLGKVSIKRDITRTNTKAIYTLKDNRIVSSFSQNNNILYFFCLDDIFRSIDNHQAIFAKLRIRCMQCK